MRHNVFVCPGRMASRKAGVITSLLVTLVVLASIGGGGYWAWQRSQESGVRTDLIVDMVSRGAFDHIVLEQGELESSSNVDITCQVRARSGGQGTPILWVVDEGTSVKEGDKLVELDDSALKTALRDKRIVVIGAEAQVAAAEAAVEQAKIARQEYLEGLFETEERAIQSEMAIAEQELRKAQLALQSSERLVARGLVKSLQLEADQFAVANSRNQLEAASNRLRVLQNLTRQKMLVQFDSAIDSAEASLAAALGSLEEEQTDLKDIQKQIELCTIYAPTAGIVIHANEYSSRGGNAEVVIAPGTIVRERQTIIRLPDPKRMQVRAKVNESRITLIESGMPAKIRVDAVNNMELLGRVIKVNRYAEPGSWFSTTIKEYATIIEIIDPPPSIRTGMTAEVQIFVEQIPNSLQVPIQAIYEHGGKTFSLVKKGDNSFETREVRIGATNEKQATILDGVNENEQVVLNLRQNLSLVDLPDLQPTENTLLAKLVADSGSAAEAAAAGESATSGPREAIAPRGPGGEAGPGGRPRGPGAGPRGPGAGGTTGGGRPANGTQSQSDNSSTDLPKPEGSTAQVKSRSDLYLERIAAERKNGQSGE
ncbi:MAG TPA: efflux transporter periplasmic adaptor subunit [Planctomycetaceae bacterium]|nr:efflux transporter periplasmic adaptor subunit [Planctomycetaceae bacterium]